MLRRSVAFLLPAVLLIACSSTSPAASTPESQGGGESSAPSQGGGESSAPSQGGGESSAPSQGGGGNGFATIDLTIEGGDYAGHYVADIVEGGCANGTQGPNSFSVASVTLDPASAFGGPQVFVYDASAAAGGTDLQFSAAFPFNNYAYTVEVNPYLSESQGSDFGSGTLTLNDRGDTATITIEGTTSAGETVNATIECHSVTVF